MDTRESLDLVKPPMAANRMLSGDVAGLGSYNLYYLPHDRDYLVHMSINSDRAAGLVFRACTNKCRALEILQEHGFAIGLHSI